MTIDYYDISVATCKQVTNAIDRCLDKCTAYCADNGIDPNDILETRLRDDMRPLRYQIFAVSLHSKDAMTALITGEFYRPESYPEDYDYAQMRQYLKDAIAALDDFTPDIINARAGQGVTVKIPNLDIPFDIADFILSFSHPNLYFHASTAYDIMRMKDVPLGKRDFLGDFRLIED